MNKRLPSVLLLLIALAGLGAQLAVTAAAWERLTYEELAESIRNAWWIAHGEIYDGISSNVVFYKLNELYYRLRGFHLFAAKELRFLLFLPALAAVVWLLPRGPHRGTLPLLAGLAFVLSPTLLYLNTSQASFGIDLQLFPLVALVWVASLRTAGAAAPALLGAAVFLLMLVAAAYPPALFFLPAMVVVEAMRLAPWPEPGERWRMPGREFWIRAGAGAFGFACALAVPFLLVRDPAQLLYDPQAGAGIFRGGGGMTWRPYWIGVAILETLSDLFLRGDSYQFELPHAEFATLVSAVAVALTLWATGGRIRAGLRAGWAGFRSRKLDTESGLLVFALVLIAVFAVMSHLSPNLPGLRRAAGMLIGFYILYYLALTWALERRWGRGWLVLLALLPAGHLWQLAGNLRDLPPLSGKDYPLWLQSEASAPASLDAAYARVAAGEPIRCAEVGGKCRYSELYGALQLRHRNGSDGGDLEVRAEDPVSGTIIPVTRELWHSYYWNH